MSATEAERHELYEIARQEVSGRFAELMMKSLPPHPDTLATKDDIALVRADSSLLASELRGEMASLGAELRGEMASLGAALRFEMGELRADLVDRIHVEVAGSTRTIVLSLVGSVTALAVANTVTLALTR